MKKVARDDNFIVLLCLLLLPMSAMAEATEITVAAANSTCIALKNIAVPFKVRYDITVNTICKSSGRLAKGLKGKAIKADLYISANKSWMDKMVEAAVVDADAVRDLWGNRLVAVVPKGGPLSLDSWDELATDKVKNIMIGDPGTAPFGRYAKQAMESTGIWRTVKHKITTKRHITLLADTVAESGHGTVGILFATNVNAGMRVIYELNAAWHQPIRYYTSYVTGAQNLEAANIFLQFLQGEDARKILSDEGFSLTQP